MQDSPDSKIITTRRDFIKTTGTVAAASALAGVVLPHVHAQGSDQIQIALVGCGGRGTGAAANALSSSGPPKIVAMADIFEAKLSSSHENLKKKFNDQVAVPDDHKFIGFDGYKKAMDCLKPGDIVILTTPCAFRWVHFKYAIEKNLHVFMEKPVAADAPTARRMIELGEEAKKKNLKVGVGLMVRHCRGRQELFDRVQKGEIGDILAMRAYRMHGPVGSAFSPKAPEGMSDLKYQISRFHSFLWLSGGLFSDFYIHQIDECSWIKSAQLKNPWPVKCHAIGGRHYRGDNIDQNFDSYQVEYTYEDGTKLFMYGRTMFGCMDNFSSVAHGSKGMAFITTASHTPGKCRIFKGQNVKSEDLVWAYPQPEANPYQLEWDDLISAIRHNEPYNEVKRGAEASLVASMGRFAAHTGQEVTYEDFYNNDHEFAPDIDKLTMDGPSPLPSDADGKYPIPEPGIKKKREY
ncbi:MAG TPA: Gfo/Idh/MocA family oxidoreductase [Roseimicrobium sp.]|nr:Gfo/Idh/MocA family oxidoreductase [Roseimicrobium sp.]